MSQLKITREQFNASIIAQDDDNDYSESGWVAGIFNGTAFLARYSHCSCYGTWTALHGDGGSLVVEWSGTPEEMLNMATHRLDPAMPSRQAQSTDYDYTHLMVVYEQILAKAATVLASTASSENGND